MELQILFEVSQVLDCLLRRKRNFAFFFEDLRQSDGVLEPLDPEIPFFAVLADNVGGSDSVFQEDAPLVLRVIVVVRVKGLAPHQVAERHQFVVLVILGLLDDQVPLVEVQAEVSLWVSRLLKEL